MRETDRLAEKEREQCGKKFMKEKERKKKKKSKKHFRKK